MLVVKYKPFYTKYVSAISNAKEDTMSKGTASRTATDNPEESIDNRDLVRMVLYFCSDKGRIFHSSTRLQKLVFLAQNKFSEFETLKANNLYVDRPLKFAADSYGPFSKELGAIVKSFEESGELKLSNEGRQTEYVITDELELKLREKIKTIRHPSVQQWLKVINAVGSLRLDELLRYVYQDPIFKEYLIRSKIKNRYSITA